MGQQQQDPSHAPVRATVADVRDTYVVVYPVRDYGDLTMGDSVTFSLGDWRGNTPPFSGQVVVLFNTTLWRRGWRAERATPVVHRLVRSQQKAKVLQWRTA